LAEVFGVRGVRIERAGVREMSEQLAYADDGTITKQSYALRSASRFIVGRA